MCADGGADGHGDTRFPYVRTNVRTYVRTLRSQTRRTAKIKPNPNPMILAVHIVWPRALRTSCTICLPFEYRGRYKRSRTARAHTCVHMIIARATPSPNPKRKPYSTPLHPTPLHSTLFHSTPLDSTPHRSTVHTCQFSTPL